MIENLKLFNESTSDMLTLSSTDTPNYILGDVNFGSVESVNYSYKYVNQVGTNITGTSYECRNMSITGWIVADTESEMSEYKNFLNRFVDPKSPIDVIYKTFKIKLYPERSIRYSTDRRENNECICKFLISGVCPYPLFSDINTKRIISSVYEPKFRFPLLFKPSPEVPTGLIMGSKIISDRIELINDGSVPTGVIATFIAKSGNVVNPKVTSVSSGEFFKLNKTMKLGEEVYINTNTGEKGVTGKEKGGEIKNYFKYLDYGSSWMQLNVGANIYLLTADSGAENLEFFIDFSNKYLEVQEWD